MNLILRYYERLPQVVRDEFESLVTQIRAILTYIPRLNTANTFTAQQTVASLVATGGVYERGRTVAMGQVTPYTATYGCSGSMTIANTGSCVQVYGRIGNLVTVVFNLVNVTLGGTASNTVTFTLPVRAASYVEAGMMFRGYTGGAYEAMTVKVDAGSTLAQIALLGNGNFTLGGGHYLYGQLTYFSV